MILGKKGEKELQLIFAVFVLVIITGVVLMLFIKTFQKVDDDPFQDEIDKSKLQLLTASCQSLCANIADRNTAIEFCSSVQSLADPSKNTIPSAKKYGAYQFCDAKIPCFLIVDNCKGGAYSPSACKDLLLSDTSTHERYADLVKNVDSAKVSNDDGCNLPTTGLGAAANWKIKFNYTDLASALGP